MCPFFALSDLAPPGAQDAAKWELACTTGIPFRLRRSSAWGNFRQHYFLRCKKEAPLYKEYGSLQNLYDHGSANGWRTLMQHLVKCEVCQKVTHDIDGDVAQLRSSYRGAGYLEKWQCNTVAQDGTGSPRSRLPRARSCAGRMAG